MALENVNVEDFAILTLGLPSRSSLRSCSELRRCPPSVARSPRKPFKSDAGRIRALIRSLDSVQNAALLLPIERQLLSQFSTAYFLTFEHMHLDCALRGGL